MSEPPHDVNPTQDPWVWDVPVVGIGTSAGGLEALHQFFFCDAE